MTFLPYVAFAAVWIGTAILDYAKYGYVWQLKEYRLRNMHDYLRSKRARMLLVNYFSFIHQRLRPRLTNKMRLILLLSLCFELLLISLFPHWWILLIIIPLRFFIISGAVGFLYIPTMLAKRYYIIRAERKIRAHPNVMVIGITGSYGKTTVKDFLSHVLSTEYHTLKTPEHINSEIGIARFILKSNFTDVDMFVVEMGAYKPGDIKIIADMVHPRIGILTAINEQHAALFGSIAIIQKTKYELLNALPKDGLAIINVDNPYCREGASLLKARVITFGQVAIQSPDYHIETAYADATGITFTCNGEKYRAPVHGVHNAMNIAPVLAVAEYLHMNPKNSKRGVSTLRLSPQNMQLLQCKNALIIDDSYNANPQSFYAALDLAATLKNERPLVVITRGMEELGSKSDTLHKEVGSRISEVAQTLVLISPDHEEALRAGMQQNSVTIRTIYDARALVAYVEALCNDECLILLENRMFTNIDLFLKEHATAYDPA